MIFGQDRSELRAMYAAAWRKHEARQPLSPLEAQIAGVVAEHPEYVAAVRGELDREYAVAGRETNPFLHMGLHLGLREQVATDRPTGIREVFQTLTTKSADPHAAEHRMIDCLAEALWEAQRTNRPPDERNYLERLRRLIR